MHPCSDTTRAGAWLKAAQILRKQKTHAYNLIVEVEQPALATPQSRAIESRVDAFLRAYDCQPIHTVAETIFPSAEYVSGGLPKVLQYPNTVFPEIKSVSANSRGTYALRLTQRAVYELDLGLEPLELKFYDPEIDHANPRGGQCLSHVSLKLGPDRELYLTALYRYQYFLQKALGNLKG